MLTTVKRYRIAIIHWAIAIPLNVWALSTKPFFEWMDTITTVYTWWFIGIGLFAFLQWIFIYHEAKRIRRQSKLFADRTMDYLYSIGYFNH